MTELDEQLVEAVMYFDVSKVVNCLEQGANANCYIPYSDLNEADEKHQPTSPLRMVVFRISDNLLEDHQLEHFVTITELLLQHGADAPSALELSELRYGPMPDDVDITTPFAKVVQLIMDAAQAT